MPNWEDYYEILDVSPDSSDEEIKDAYLYKVNILHPDRLAGVSESIRHRAQEDLKRVNRAYEILKDPQKRKEFHTEWIKRSAGPQKAIEKPEPMADPPHIVFSDVEPGEAKRGSFTIRNVGGPYQKIFITDPDSWVRIIRCDSLTTSDELPLEVEIEAKADDWGKSYSEYIKIRLDEEETFVRVDLHTKTKAEAAKSKVSGVAGAGAAKPPPVKSQVSTSPSKRRLWAFSILGVFIILVIVAVVSNISEPTSPPPTPPTSPTAAPTRTPRAEATLIPTSGPVGTTVALSGTRFIADTIVTITYDGNQVATTTVPAEGTFSATFVVPSSQPGQYTIAATDGTNTVSKTFTVLAPPPPVTVISQAESVSIIQQVAPTPAGKGLLTVGLRYADSKPMVNKRVEVHTQRKDVSGNWVWDERITYKNTDNGGTVSFELEPGHYALRISAFQGYNWGNMAGDEGQVDMPVKIGYLTEVTITSGRLTVELAYADGKPMVNKRVEVHTQRKDVTGNWVWDERITYKNTENSGRVSFDLTPGLYALRISGLDGYNWGNMVGDVGEVNVAVRSGEMTVKRVDLGRLTVGLTTTEGEAAQNAGVYVYTQKQDVSGKWVQDNQVDYERTDNSGMVSFDLTLGQYAIRFRRPGESEDRYLFNISVEGGKITTVVK